MERRDFLRFTAAICGAGASTGFVQVPPNRSVRLQPDQDARPEHWRTFEITTHVHVQQAAGTTRVWLPTPIAVAPYQNTLGDTYQIEGGSVLMIERDGIDLLAAEWPAGPEPILTLVSRAATTERAVDFSTPTVAPPRDFSAFSAYLRAMKAPPLDDAAVKSTAGDITKGAGTDLDRTRAIFDWTIHRTEDLGSPDLHTLFIALVRAAGVPARPVYGLGVAQPDATRAQQDRVEVYLVGYGWTPVDARDRRFGSWAERWIAYNSAEDLLLPGSTTGSLRYFMHPQGETARRRIDGLDAAAFRYTIAVREE